MTKTVAIVQSSYIPWKGYFDLVRSVDEFVILDDVQYSKGSWRNRNRIKTPDGVRWLTIPVQFSLRHRTPVYQVETVDGQWANKHWRTLRQSYAEAEHFGRYAPSIEAAYDRAALESRLSAVNLAFIHALCRILAIDTPITDSRDYPSDESATGKLVAICRAAGATRYLSGPSARDYLEPARFDQAGIELEFFDYSGYPRYRQLHGPFKHRVSVLDLIFNEGPRAPELLRRNAG